MDRRKNRNKVLSMPTFKRSIFVALLFFLFGFQLASIWFNLSHVADTEKREGSKTDYNEKKNGLFSRTLTQQSVSNEIDMKAIKSLLQTLVDPNKSMQNETSVSEQSLPACQQEKVILEPGTLVWKPQPMRYLIALCSGGQLSNRLSCIRQSMLDAALLNRTLILPTKGLDYNFDDLLDLDAISECFGPDVFLTLEQYELMINKQVRISRLICHVHVYQTEDICKQLGQKYKQLYNLTYGKEEIAKRRTPSPWFKYPSYDFIKKFQSGHHVLAFINMMGVGGRDMRMIERKPFSVNQSCNGFLQPSKAIKETALGFIDSMLGKHFMSVHIRRGDFFNHCLRGSAKAKSLQCMLPMPQVAKCIADKLNKHTNVNALFVATNADEEEFEILKTVIYGQSKGIPIIRLDSAKNKVWSEPLLRRKLDNDPVVLSFVEKTICAHSMIFYSTPGSTFSGDIHRLRSWWKGENTSCDGFICPREQLADIIPLE